MKRESKATQERRRRRRQHNLKKLGKCVQMELHCQMYWTHAWNLQLKVHFGCTSSSLRWRVTFLFENWEGRRKFFTFSSSLQILQRHSFDWLQEHKTSTWFEENTLRRKDNGLSVNFVSSSTRLFMLSVFLESKKWRHEKKRDNTRERRWTFHARTNKEKREHKESRD